MHVQEPRGPWRSGELAGSRELRGRGGPAGPGLVGTAAVEEERARH